MIRYVYCTDRAAPRDPEKHTTTGQSEQTTEISQPIPYAKSSPLIAVLKEKGGEVK
jgi:hypothetical protein